MSDKITTIRSIIITDLGADGATVSYPKNLDWVASFKATFPKARWATQSRVWGIPGKLAAARAKQWAERMTEHDGAADRQRAIDAANFDGVISKYVTLSARMITIRTAYHADLTTLCRRLGGRWDGTTKVWTIDAANLAAVISVIPEINRLADDAAAREAATKAGWAAERAETARQIAAERGVCEAAQAAARAHRWVVLASRAPDVGAVLRHGSSAVVVESLGKSWRADDDLSSLGGPVGVEGEWVRYAYWREATATEISTLEAREAATKAADYLALARRTAIAEVEAGEIGPDLGHAPDGEVIWSDDTHAATGYSRRIVLTADRWLWSVTYDGSDGAAWGTYNCGYNTVGRRVEATPARVAAIRGGE